jgi:hypothetical protein
MNLVNTEELFYNIDKKLFPMLGDVTLLIKEVKDSLDKYDISMAMRITEKSPGTERFLGEPIIEMMEKMSKFVDDYNLIKKTWCITAPSSDINNQK